MEDIETDPQQLEKQRKLWKLFGRQTKAAEKPKINYPKVRPKTQKEIDEQKQKMINTKKCPQKTLIQYPQEPIPQSKFHAIDFVPKRKAQSVIRKQIEQYYRRRAIDKPANRGVDRAALVKKLQQKFKMQSGGLPKSIQLPGLNGKVIFDQQKIKQQAKLKIDKKFKNYTTPIKKQNIQKQVNQDHQLQLLFDNIVAEIDQRQQYLQSINNLDQPKLKQRIKNQMIQRIAQLQKITQMKNKK